MVRVHGSSGDSRFHRESRDEDVKIKTEPEIGASAEYGSPQTREEKGSQDQRSLGRGYGDKKVKEEDHQADLEENLNPLLRSLRAPPWIVLQSSIFQMETSQ
uniref:Uncharacterized protein n=1 Tax=Peronospora matthiolae TaxID=2874970 RepID=A0AAV1VMB4_9STRA